MSEPPKLRGWPLHLRKTFFKTFFLFLTFFVTSGIATVPLPDGEAPDGTKYKTAYRCEGESMTIFCDPGETIQVIRANYGRFSIAICNKHGYTDWSVNCMSQTTTRVLQRRCDTRRRCEIDVSSQVFGDPCPGTHKYVEIHYACLSQFAGSQLSAGGSTQRLPPWLLEGGASNLWSSNQQNEAYDDELEAEENFPGIVVPPILSNPSDSSRTPSTTISSSPQRKPILVAQDAVTSPKDGGGPRIPITTAKTVATTTTIPTTTTPPPPTTPISSSSSSDDQQAVTSSNGSQDEKVIYGQTSDDTKKASPQPEPNEEELVQRLSSSHCRPTLSRRLNWNWTRTGEVAIQPCPAGASGLARWSCQTGGRKMRASQLVSTEKEVEIPKGKSANNNNGPVWKGTQPDMSDCKSKDMTDLEARVRQQDPENVLASTLAHLTEKKIDDEEEDGAEPRKHSQMFGGDLEASVAVIKAVANRLRYLLQTQADSFYNKESYVQEVFQNILRSASNLLSPDSRAAWLDLSRPQRLKVASSLMRCLEEHSFLVANVIQTPETIVEATKRAVTAISVIDSQSASFSKQNGTSFPSSLFPFYNGNTTSTNSSSANRVNQHQKNPTPTPNGLLNDWSDIIHLPNSAIKQLRPVPTKDEQRTLVRIVFYAYKNLHQLLSDADQQLSGQESLEGENLVVNSRVISASIDGASTSSGDTKISDPVTMTLQHLQKTTASLSDVVCVYWDLEEDAWVNRGCRVVTTNATHTECECDHLTSFALLTASSGLVGSEMVRSIGSGILFDSDSALGSATGDSDSGPAVAASNVLTLEIATYLVSTVCLLILILILVQFRHQIRRGLKHTTCCSSCCRSRNHSTKGHHDDIIDKTHHQLYASTANNGASQNGVQLHLEQGLSNGSSTSSGSTSSTGTSSSSSVDPNKRMMQSMVTIRPHQAQAKVTVLPTESKSGLVTPSTPQTTSTTNWFRTGKSTTNNKTGLTNIIKLNLRGDNNSPTSTTQDNLLCTLPRTTLQRRPVNSPQSVQLSTAKYLQHGPRQHLEPPSTVTVNPYDTNLDVLNGCDTDSSDSQYASVVNLPASISPTFHKRQQQYFTTRLRPTRQQQAALHDRQMSNRNPYVSPQLSRLTSTLRPSGYNPMDTCSNSSTNSSPQRTALTHLSSSSTTVSSAQLGSPYHFLGNRFNSQMDGNSEVSSLHHVPLTESTLLSHENSQHVYCEIPMTTSPRMLSGSQGNYDNLRWLSQPGNQPVNQTAKRGRNWQPQPPPKYCRETDEEETVTYADDTACDLQNVSDLSDDEQQQQLNSQHQQRGTHFKPADCDFWMSSFGDSSQAQTHSFPSSDQSPAKAQLKTPKRSQPKPGGGVKSNNLTGEQSEFMVLHSKESRRQKQ